MNRRLGMLLGMGLLAASGLVGQIVITSPQNLAVGYTNVYYTYTFTAGTQGVIGPLSWSSPTPAQLPPGITVSQNGTLAGTTTLPGTFMFDVSASGSGFTTTGTFTLIIQKSQIQINAPNPLPNAFVGHNYSLTLQAASLPATVQWLPATMPPGLTFTNGLISGIPTQTGTFNITISAEIAGTQISSSVVLVLNIYLGQVEIATTSLPFGSLGQMYSYTIDAGPPGLTWTLSGPLPLGIAFDFATGKLSGTPTITGIFPLHFQATQQGYLSAAADLTMYVVSGPLDVPITNLPPGVQGYAYTATAVATGGLPPYTYAWGTANTDGLSVNAATGVITGTPPTSGSLLLPLVITDATRQGVTINLSIPIERPLTVSTDSLPDANVGQGYRFQVASDGGTNPVAWALTSGSLPAGLTFSPAGLISGTPTQTGTFSFTLQATDSGGRTANKTLQLSVSIPPVSITTSSLPPAPLSSSYSQALAAAGGIAPYTWSLVSGQLPAGLQLNAGGTITGTPKGPLGTSAPFTLQVSDSSPRAPQTAQKAFTITVSLVLTITSQGPLPAGTVGAAYSDVPLIASGGVQPYTWSISSGSLPPGLQLNASTGAITGTPTSPGSTVFAVLVSDTSGQTASQQLSLAINPLPPAVTTSGTYSATAGSAFSLTLAGSGGTAPYTWSATGLPAGLLVSGSKITGTPTSSGSFAVTLTLTDANQQTATASITITVTLPPAPAVTIGAIPAVPASQPSVGVILGTPYPLDLTVILTVNFQSASGGAPTEVGFINSSGVKTSSVSFTIPAGTTGPPSNAPVLITGTVAGTITVTAALTAAGINITPNTVPSETIAIPASAPVIQSVNFSNTGGGLTVVVTGYSTTREVSSGSFTFAAGTGSSLAQNTVTVQLASAFSTWFSSPASNQYGGQFQLTVPFSVSGTAADVIGVSVTLTNSKGTSAAASPQ